MAWGGNIRSVSRFDPLLASKTTGVDDEQLYFHVDQLTHVGVPRKNLSTEQRRNPTLGLIRHCGTNPELVETCK